TVCNVAQPVRFAACSHTTGRLPRLLLVSNPAFTMPARLRLSVEWRSIMGSSFRRGPGGWASRPVFEWLKLPGLTQRRQGLDVLAMPVAGVPQAIAIRPEAVQQHAVNLLLRVERFF